MGQVGKRTPWPCRHHSLPLAPACHRLRSTHTKTGRARGRVFSSCRAHCGPQLGIACSPPPNAAPLCNRASSAAPPAASPPISPCCPIGRIMPPGMFCARTAAAGQEGHTNGQASLGHSRAPGWRQSATTGSSALVAPAAHSPVTALTHQDHLRRRDLTSWPACCCCGLRAAAKVDGHHACGALVSSVQLCVEGDHAGGWKAGRQAQQQAGQASAIITALSGCAAARLTPGVMRGFDCPARRQQAHEWERGSPQQALCRPPGPAAACAGRGAVRWPR